MEQILIKDLPEPIIQLVIAEQMRQKKQVDFTSDLQEAFIWSISTQSNAFWRKVYNAALAKEPTEKVREFFENLEPHERYDLRWEGSKIFVYNDNGKLLTYDTKMSKNLLPIVEAYIGKKPSSDGQKDIVKIEEAKDHINPAHYKQYPVETWEMMLRIWGKEKLIAYCEMTAFKYRMRMGHKDNVEQEMNKEKWYLDKAQELRNVG